MDFNFAGMRRAYKHIKRNDEEINIFYENENET